MKVYLPEWVETKADRFATDHVEGVLGLSPSSRKYKSEFEKAKNRFCKEFYELSTGIKVSNPVKKINIKGYFTR